MKAVLLGTGGGPRASRTRFPTSQAILVDGRMIVIDCGNGVAKQLSAAGLSARDMTHLLVTHHHVDHSADLGYLPIAAWIEGRTDAIQVLGPPPTVGAMEALLVGYAEDLDKRTSSTGRPPFRPMLDVEDITTPGQVLEQAGLEISCAFVDHPPFEIALGYRVDFAGKSVVVSGDTAPSPALVELAQGADVLIHEVVHPEAFAEVTKNTNASTIREHMSRNHTMLDDVGRIAAEAGVGRLVLSHMIPHNGLTAEEWTEPIRPHFDGEIIVGEDLMEIDI
jgi:ribonuclease BN (tRNA processing enzyme)